MIEIKYANNRDLIADPGDGMPPAPAASFFSSNDIYAPAEPPLTACRIPEMHAARRLLTPVLFVKTAL